MKTHLTFVDGERPLVVLFVAPDCYGSRLLGQTLNALARDYRGRLDFVSVNVTRDVELARRFQVYSTPSLVVLSKGAVLYQAIGTLPEHEVNWILQVAQRSAPGPHVFGVHRN